MDEITYHISLFPPRLKNVLASYSAWERVCEIRLRCDGVLSLTTTDGNVILDESGAPSSAERGVRCREEELLRLLGAFCGGSVYRYFDRLQDGFAVDDYGWRMGICAEQTAGGLFLPQKISGINLRIPRQNPSIARPVAERLHREGLFSFLIFSAPGEGKTTLLRALAATLSLGVDGKEPLRVAVIDEKSELFPPQMQVETGLLDVLSPQDKGEGIAMATRLFSPQVILCDEIGNAKESEAILEAGGGGCNVIATAHARTLQEALQIPYLARLIRSGRFAYGLFLSKEDGHPFRIRFHWEKFQ